MTSNERSLEFGWFLPTSGDSTAYGLPEASISPDPNHFRKVVVAAEAANRYLNEDMVDCERLGELFDIVGWQQPHSFIQTLRNAARSKFRWLERVPGRSGKYMVTEVGRRTAFDRV